MIVTCFRHDVLQTLIKEAEEECKRASTDVEVKTEQARLANSELSKIEARLEETRMHAKSMLFRCVYVIVCMHRSVALSVCMHCSCVFNCVYENQVCIYDCVCV